MPDIFVSYPPTEKRSADAIVAALEGAGATCWYAHRDIPPGADFCAELRKGVDACPVLLHVTVALCPESPLVRQEVDWAMGSDKVVIPVTLDALAPIPSDVVTFVVSVMSTVKGQVQPPDVTVLNICGRCGAQYDENNPSGCSYHSEPPTVVGNAGPERDHADVWLFPCCGRKYVGLFHPETEGETRRVEDTRPRRSPGCIRGMHAPRYHFNKKNQK